MVRIRMQRFGRTHRPFYRINAIDGRVKRNGAVLENLGWYNPVETKPDLQLHLKTDRIKEWIAKGAQPSETVMDILGNNELLEGDMLDAWNKRREIELRRGRCKAAIKTIEAAIETLEKLAEESEAEIQPSINICKRSLNDAKRTVSMAVADTAEKMAAAATEALEAGQKADSDAKAKAAAEAPAEEAAEGGDEEAPAEEG